MQNSNQLQTQTPDQPLISIVLPTRNGERYLLESLESCFSQTWSNFEIIIVNDESTDRTHDIIQSIKDSRVRYIRCFTNVRLPVALNIGFAAARGEFLTWTSDDNRYHPTALARMAAVLEAGHDFVYTHCRKIGGEGQSLGLWRAGPPDYLSEFQSVGACFLYRRRVYQQIGLYDPSAFLVEDYDYWIRVWMAGFRMRLLPIPLYDYRDHEENLRSTFGKDRVTERRDEIRARHLSPSCRRFWRVVRLLRKGCLLVTNRRQLEEERRAGFTVPDKLVDTMR